MDFTKNYYALLGVVNSATEKEIKKAYYKLSFTHHPDKGGDELVFSEITEAYDVLMSDLRKEYDKKSKWGSDYDETVELLRYEFDNLAKAWDEEKINDWKEKNQHNIVIKVSDNFNNEDIEFNRWVRCKKCGGDGRDTSSKIVIKDEFGNIKGVFEGSDGCDFCDGTGKDWNNNPCYFCGGKGKTGFNPCKSCNGEKRILGKQKVKKVKWEGSERSMCIKGMGNLTVDGRVGDLWLVKNKRDDEK